MPEEEKERFEVYAVSSGSCFVKMSSFYDAHHSQYELESFEPNYQAWSSKENRDGQWIQIGCEFPKYWTAVIVRGRGTWDQWVKTIKMSSTIDGKTWRNIEDGR